MESVPLVFVYVFWFYVRIIHFFIKIDPFELFFIFTFIWFFNKYYKIFIFSL